MVQKQICEGRRRGPCHDHDMNTMIQNSYGHVCGSPFTWLKRRGCGHDHRLLLRVVMYNEHSLRNESIVIKLPVRVGLTLSGGRPRAGPERSERPSAGETRQARMSGLVFALGALAFAFGSWR